MIKNMFDFQGNAMTRTGMKAFSVAISNPRKQKGRPDFYCRVKFSAPYNSSINISGVSEAQAVGLALDYVKANLVYLVYSDGSEGAVPELTDSFPLRM
jgi:hypothetical protein